MIIKLYNGRVKLLYGTRWAVCGPCTRSTPPHNGMRRPTTRDVPRQDDRELRSIKNILNRIVECFATGRGIEPGLVSITDRQQRPFPGYEFLPFSYYVSWLNFYRWYPRKMRIIIGLISKLRHWTQPFNEIRIIFLNHRFYHKYLNVILIDTFYYFYELIKIYNLREKPARRKLL